MKSRFLILFIFIICLFSFNVMYVNADRCTDLKDEKDCISNGCSYNTKYNFCSPNGLTYLKCGDAYDIPEIVPTISSYAVNILKTATPIILIAVAIIQLVKAIASSKEDDIKKAQGSLIKKIIAAVLVFFVITIAQFVMLKFAADDVEKGNLSNCLSCFLNGKSKCNNFYYKSSDGNCVSISGNESFQCK